MQLEVVDGDISTLEVDAIANAANDRLWMGSGVAGAIKRAGGEEIEREAVGLGPIPVGDAVATGAGRLAAKHVIHGAVMGQDLRTDEQLVAKHDPPCPRGGRRAGRTHARPTGIRDGRGRVSARGLRPDHGCGGTKL